MRHLPGYESLRGVDPRSGAARRCVAARWRWRILPSGSFLFRPLVVARRAAAPPRTVVSYGAEKKGFALGRGSFFRLRRKYLMMRERIHVVEMHCKARETVCFRR